MRILYVLNRRRELRRLLTWAQGNKLAGPARAYRKGLSNEDIRLSQHAMRHPSAYRIARIIHTVNTVVFPIPFIHRSGAARAYRARLA